MRSKTVRLAVAFTAAAVLSMVGEGVAQADPPPLIDSCAQMGADQIGTMYNRIDELYEYWVFMNCDNDPTRPVPGEDPAPDRSIVVQYWNQPPVMWCLPNWGWQPIGEKTRFGPPETGTIKHISEPVVIDGCPGVTPPEPPRVEITGRLVLKPSVHDAPGQLPLRNARYELKGLINGTSDPQHGFTWQTIRTGPGNAGEDVTGFLDEDGRFELDFVYPAPSYTLPDWENYYGCEAKTPYMYQQWAACWDPELRLEVYAEAEDGSRVNGTDGQLAKIKEIPLGLFFQREDGLTHETNAAAAHAFRAVQNVQDFTEQLPDSLRLEDVDVQLLSGGSDFDNRYNPETGMVQVSQSLTGTSDVEFHAASKYYHDLLGPAYPGYAQDCLAVDYSEVTSDLCAMQLGFAGFIANAAENTQNQNQLVLNNVGYDIEHCTRVSSAPLRMCDEGPQVAARVAAALRDLHDAENEAGVNPVTGLPTGFADYTTHQLVPVVLAATEFAPASADEFWDDWRAVNGSQDRLMMFMNTLEYTDLQDDGDNLSTDGQWNPSDCSTCRNGSRLVATSAIPSEIIWDLSRNITTAGNYDVLVRLAGPPNGCHASADYIVDTAAGETTFEVNQCGPGDGWHNLSATGAGVLDPGPAGAQLRLEGVFVEADAIIVAPNETPVTPLPRVTITGRVEATALPGIQGTPIKNAYYKARWRDSSGQLHDLRTGPGDTGDVVEGYLGADGEFALDNIYYPTTYTLPDGTTWTGCTPTTLPLNGSHFACADDAFVLEVSPWDQTDSVVVKNERDGDRASGAELGIGHFHQRPPGHTYDANNLSLAAYRAAYNVKDVVTALAPDHPLAPLDVVLTYRDYIYRYRAAVDVDSAAIDYSNPEVIIAAKYLYDLRGIFDYPELPEDCDRRDFLESAPESCAVLYGFAQFIAAAAENYSGSDSDSVITFRGGIGEADARYDLESCTAVGSGEECKDDSAGRIAAMLWDLHDVTDPMQPVEGRKGFLDEVAGQFGATIEAYADATPDTFMEFWRELQAQTESEALRSQRRNAAFLNTFLYTWIADNKNQAFGDWSQVACAGCVGGLALLSAPASASNPTIGIADWDVPDVINPEAGKFDLWVHLPSVVPASELANAARFSFVDSAGPVERVIDLSAVGGWVLVDKEGMEIAGTSIMLSGTSATLPGRRLLADAVMFVPHEEY